MKKNIHPKWFDEAEIAVNDKVVAKVGSTQEKINVVIWSGNHPFYTGEEVFVDTDNLIEKFNEKLKVASSSKSIRSKKEKKKSRVEKRNAAMGNSPVTLKDMLKNLG